MITPEQARVAAVAAVPDTVQVLNLKHDEGPLVYVVVQPQGGGRTEVQVDAQTGNVVRTLPSDQRMTTTAIETPPGAGGDARVP